MALHNCLDFVRREVGQEGLRRRAKFLYLPSLHLRPPPSALRSIGVGVMVVVKQHCPLLLLLLLPLLLLVLLLMLLLQQ